MTDFPARLLCAFCTAPLLPASPWDPAMTRQAAGGLWPRSKAPGAELTRGRGWREGGGEVVTAAVSDQPLCGKQRFISLKSAFFSQGTQGCFVPAPEEQEQPLEGAGLRVGAGGAAALSPRRGGPGGAQPPRSTHKNGALSSPRRPGAAPGLRLELRGGPCVQPAPSPPVPRSAAGSGGRDPSRGRARG